MSAQAFAAASARAGLVVPISWVERTVSTNAVLKEAVVHGVPHGTALVAGAQLGGRGRLGRTWGSPEGNLYLSVVLRPALPLAQVSLVCLATAVAVIDVFGADRLRIKWPNDVLSLSDHKVAGILAEAEVRGGVLDAVVVGVGIN
ncbi:MAG: BirA family biotin operon repressor/biotin-[acetyl-CoA-carboxylase] ligase, partial [Kiritimatiellia bacterium]